MVEGFRNTDAGLLPIDWQTPRLANISDFENGKAHEQFIDDKGDYIVVNSRFISTEGETVKFSNKKLSPLRKGNIAIVMSDIPNGRALAKCFLVDRDDCYTLNQRIGCIKAKQDLDNNYLFYILNRNKYFLSFDSGSGQTNLRRSEILDCPVALPPTKAEQTAIATALNDADALIAQLEKLIAKKRAIKQGAMQELLKPKEGWEVKKLGDVAEFYKGKGLAKSAIIPDGEIECIHYGELFTGYGEEIKEIRKRTNKFNGAFYSRGNDVLMPTSDVTPNGLATASCIPKSGVILGGDILVIRFTRESFDGVFFSYLIKNNRNQVMQLVKGITVYHLHASDMKEFVFSHPTKFEQNRIAQILSDMDAEIEALESNLAKYKMLKQGMMQNLLTGRIRLV